jgi:SAM-dependent methyltransferase
MTNSLYTASFTEEEIRSNDFTAEKLKAYQQDIDWLQERKGDFIEVNCPGCGKSKKDHFHTKNNFDYVKCSECKTVFMCPRPPANLLHEFYKVSKGYEFWNKYIFPDAEPVRREKLCKPRIREIIQLCKNHHVGHGCFVEVGPGFGTFTEEVVKTGFFKKSIVVEPSPKLAATCRGKNLNVIESVIENAEFQEKVDVVATFEVVEHLFDPKIFIEGCRKVLNVGGLLCMTCPCIQGFDFLGAGREGAPLDHEHLNYFNPKSMSILLERCGFRVVTISTPGVLDVELVRSAALRGEISLEGQPFLKHILIEDWDENRGRRFQEFLSQNLLSGHMWAVGQKVN